VRVKISYGAEMNEVPEEVDQLYTYVSGKVRHILRQSEQIEDLLAEEDMETSLTLIDRMRLTLSAMDSRLSDIQAITEGYLTHQQGEEDVYQRRPDMDSSGDSPTNTGSPKSTGDQDN
jgi:hypothetical protein